MGDVMTANSLKISTIFYATAFSILLGYILLIGASTLIPIVWAVISVYILNRAETTLFQLFRNVPVLQSCPLWLRRAFVLVGFIWIVSVLVSITIANFNAIQMNIEGYQKNLENMVQSLAVTLGFENVPTWEALLENTVGQVDLNATLLSLVNSLASTGGQVFLITIYAVFLLGESDTLRRKTQIAFGHDAEKSLELFDHVNRRIGDYLTIKTLINVILGVISFMIMFAFGVDYAIFWAIAIGLLNYIPYVGSLLGVVFPVALSLAQFGNITLSIALAVLLTSAQMFVGNVLEPKMIGKSVNLSGFVVLIALVVWSALWGINGAILAVPLTSMIMIILAGIPDTRFIAVYLSNDGDVSH
jgi:predicted PurR-regulated permease PerM